MTIFYSWDPDLDKLGMELRDDSGVASLSYATDLSAGFDIRSTVDIETQYSKVLVPTGFFVYKVTLHQSSNRLIVPELQIRNKSGKALKTDYRVANSPGTVDCDYPGEIMVILENIKGGGISIKRGDAVAQGVFSLVCRPISQNSKARIGGFGSTGE